jgi:hypothetical protein
VTARGPDEEAPDELEARSKALFDDSVERLDGRTRSRLTQARHAALDELRAPRHRWFGFRLPAAGLATIALAAVMLVTWSGLRQPNVPGGGLPLDDFDIVADSDNLEMLQDVEFYAWLEDGPQTAPDRNTG